MSKKMEIKTPSVGKSVTQMNIESWEKQSGDTVKKGETGHTLKEQRIEARKEWEELKEEKRQLEQEIQNTKNQADRKFALYKNQFPDNKGLKINAEKLYQKVRELEKQSDELSKDIQIAKEKWGKLKRNR